MIDENEYAFLAYVLKGKTADEIRAHYEPHEGSEFIRWGNANFFIAQNPVNHKYTVTIQGRQAMYYRKTYGPE